ncbi:hypothetical protein BT96DRAFT_939676 [Gymnopus androsaceus JB14]|uniref:Uncharacterized protein n=1 Tax=Gymnopus androsaceus JB14 TaxID=1447944 RepID=A0A6A4HJZ5_9AGAR|nr:hypothetical protein BT96DRAFT_939676 [Gymnopus androsaceus JB14]
MPPGSHETELTIALTTYTLTKGKAKKAVSVLKKDTGPAKTKSTQFLFTPDEENYFKATMDKLFCMKIAVPLKKKTQACDVDNYEEYSIEAQKIIENKPSGAVLVFVDGKQISETCGKAKKKAHNSADSDDDEEDEDNIGQSNLLAYGVY